MGPGYLANLILPGVGLSGALCGTNLLWGGWVGRYIGGGWGEKVRGVLLHCRREVWAI